MHVYTYLPSCVLIDQACPIPVQYPLYNCVQTIYINHSFALTLSLFLSLLRKNNTPEALPNLTYILQRMALATFTTQQADNSHFLQYFTIMDLIQ